MFEATPAPEGETDADREARRESVLTAWHAFEPRDTMEQMLATQIVACFFAALDCQRRAVAEGSTVTAIRLYAQTTGMHRAMRQAVQALERYREKVAMATAAAVAREGMKLVMQREARPDAAAPVAPKTPIQPIHREKLAPVAPAVRTRPADPVLDSVIKGLGVGGSKRDLLGGAAMLPVSAAALPVR